MRLRMGHAGSIAVPALVAGLLFGCQSGEGTVEVGFASTGQALTTAPSSAATSTHLFLTVSRVDVHVAGEGSSDDDDHPGGLAGGPSSPPSEGGWITVFSGAAKVDLLDTGAVETFLGSAATPSGKITQIRLILSDATWTDGTISSPVACPSCSQTGLKIVTMGKLVVPPGGTLHVKLDLNREQSISQAANGLRLDPVVKIAP
jgi:hypothetical protein